MSGRLHDLALLRIRRLELRLLEKPSPDAFHRQFARNGEEQDAETVRLAELRESERQRRDELAAIEAEIARRTK